MVAWVQFVGCQNCSKIFSLAEGGRRQGFLQSVKGNQLDVVFLGMQHLECGQRKHIEEADSVHSWFHGFNLSACVPTKDYASIKQRFSLFQHRVLEMTNPEALIHKCCAGKCIKAGIRGWVHLAHALPWIVGI